MKFERNDLGLFVPSHGHKGPAWSPQLSPFAGHCPDCGSWATGERPKGFADCKCCGWRGNRLDLIARDKKGRIPRHRRPAVRQVAAAIAAIYASNDGGAGCCLHVLTDYGNLNSIDFCIEVAREKRHAECAKAAMLLGKLTISGRKRAIRMAQGRPQWRPT